jgi:hypothetical protein
MSKEEAGMELHAHLCRKEHQRGPKDQSSETEDGIPKMLA